MSFQNGNFIPQSHFVISLSDNEGQLYDAYIAVEWDDTFWISSITAQKNCLIRSIQPRPCPLPGGMDF